MTLGEKLSKLRKEYNYTQEQLADILGVSRQSISKWESDIAYPETDKLIKMGKLFECSMDYLLKEEVTEKQGAQPAKQDAQSACKESFGADLKPPFTSARVRKRYAVCRCTTSAKMHEDFLLSV